MKRTVHAGRRRVLWVLAAAAALWVASGIRQLDPAREIGVVATPFGAVRAAGSWALAPPGAFHLARYSRYAVELDLPQAEEAMLRGSGGRRFGFRGRITVKVRPERWREVHRAARGDLRRAVVAAVRTAGRGLLGEGGPNGKPPALAKDFESRLSKELAGRGLDLLRFHLVELDFLAVPAGTHLPATDTRLLVVGLDGADWEVMDPLLREGRLPNLARLIHEGVRANLLTISPTLSPVVWTTIATGVEPSRHGILDFLVPDAGGGAGRPVSSLQRTAATIWEMLSRARVKVGVVGWWATWPAEVVNGYLVSDRIAYQLFGYRSDLEDPAGKTWPADLYASIRPRIVAPERIPWGQVLPYLSGGRKRAEQFDAEERKLLDGLRTLLASGRTYLRIALDLRSRFHPRFEAVYFEGTDTVSHLFMRYRPPKLPGVSEKRYRSFRDVVDRYYETADRYLGKLLEDKGPEWTVIVLSDHGFLTGASRPRTTDSRIGHGAAADWHRRFGILVLSGRHVRRGTRLGEARIYDIAPTVLALFGQPVPASWPGRVLAEALEPAFLDAHLVRLRPDDPKRSPVDAAAPATTSGPVGEEFREKLRSLGYLAAGDESGSATTWNNRGVSYLTEGRYGEAESAFRRALEQPSAPRGTLLVNLGLALRSQGRGPEARKCFTEAMKFPSARRAATLQLAQLAMENDDLDGAERRLRALLHREPGASRAHNLLGLVLESRGDLEGARKEYREAARVDANAAEPRSNLGSMARRRGDLDEAEKWYREAIEADPHFMGAYNNLAMVYQDRGEDHKAIDLYARALSRAPNNAVVMNNLASLYYATGDVDEARKLWTRAQSVAPDYPSPLNNLAGLAIADGELDEAERLLRRALDLDPDYGDARVNLALVAVARGDRDAARRQLERAAADPKARASAELQLGRLALEGGEAASAVRHLRAAGAAGASGPSLLNLLGQALERAGDRNGARQAWTESLAADPNQPGVRRLLERLDSKSVPKTSGDT